MHFMNGMILIKRGKKWKLIMSESTVRYVPSQRTFMHLLNLL